MGLLLSGVRWEVSMNFGERLHFEVGMRTSIYIPSILVR